MRSRHMNDLPGPRPWPLAGNLPQMRPLRIHQDVEAWARQYGPLFKITFGRTPLLVVADHELVSAVLRDRPDGFRRPAITASISDEMGGRPGVFLAEGTAWRDQRRMVMAALAPHAVKAYFPSLVSVALRLQQRWRTAAHDGDTIDLAEDLKRYSIDIVAGLAFGTEVNTIDGGEDVIQRHMDVVLPAVARRSIALFPYWRYLKLPQDRQLDTHLLALNKAVDELVAAARARLAAEPSRRAHPANLLEAMICAADEGGSGVTDDAVAGNVTTMLLAGEDTTSNTLAWMLYLLQQNPAAMHKAREEVMRIAPDVRAFTIEQMDALDYLDACAQEAMRLKPVAPFIPLEALRDSVVGDVQVPKGGLLWCVMRNDSVTASHVPEAAAFQPERWLQRGEGAISKHVSMPFGAGLRTCPGRYLALLEIKIASAMLLSSFDIASIDTIDGKEPEELMAFTMSPIGLRMRLQHS
ncbi:MULTISPECIES: cytochrome P450 [unclassified Duganella]|uniref:cytochrome P450 n=1 Tax=unclassified Duganella TaxID=2636909 RepID=UPI00088C4F1F|nr:MULTISPECIES: cytochrome P450 [unclassified Duganella]SDG04478.1 Cytochrome P450 [Duganella sp. OV458]SDJ00963.1 Cytochrome P450 [Duganella sp. OV510]